MINLSLELSDPNRSKIIAFMVEISSLSGTNTLHYNLAYINTSDWNMHHAVKRDDCNDGEPDH